MKALKILVVVMGLLIVVGVAVLVTLAVDRASGKSRAPSAETPTTTTLPLPADARVVETTSTDDRVAIRVAAPGEPDRLYLIDHHTGAVRSVITLGGPSETKP